MSRKESTPGGAKEEGPSIMTLKAKPSVPLLLPVVSRINLLKVAHEKGTNTTGPSPTDSDDIADLSVAVDPTATSTHVQKALPAISKGIQQPPPRQK